MSDLFLDTRNRMSIVDFMVDVAPFLLPEHPTRERVEAFASDVDEGRLVTTEQLVSAAREVGRATWVPRITLKRYLRTRDGQHDEWRRVVAAVSNSTAHIMERFRAGTKRDSVDEVLSHEDSSRAFRDNERIEIQEVRIHIHPVMWHEKSDELREHAKTHEEELREIERRIRQLRDIGFSTEAIDDSEIVSKIERIEDRLYFQGEEVSIERLDEEIILYREQKELSIELSRGI